MAANWWKYGLCVFGGLGIGYVVGVKITKNKCEEDYENKVADIREIYRNDRKAKKPAKKKEEEPKSERPEIQTKTSIDTEKLSERKEKAREAENKYSKAFKPDPKPGTEEEETSEEAPENEQEWLDYIHIVDEFPEDQDPPYREETLNYYADGVVTRSPTDQRLTDEECFHLVGGNETLRRLDEDDCNELRVTNDLYRINYTIIFRYQEWAEVVEEEPYKAEL